MGQILEAFAQDQLRADTITEERGPQHQQTYERSIALQEEFEERLNEEDKKRFHELIDLMDEVNCYSLQNKFIRGYRLGALMMMEILQNQTTYLGNAQG